MGTLVRTATRGVGLEEASRRAVEVITMWQETVLRVDLLEAGGKARREFRVGSEGRCDVALGPESLGGVGAVALVTCDAAGAAIALPPNATGDLSSKDGAPTPLDAERDAWFPLPDGAQAAINLGALTFLVRSVARPLPLAAGRKVSLGDQAWSGASLALHALVVFVAFFDVPNLLAMSFDALDDLRNGVRYEPVELRRKEIAKEAKREDAASPGKRHRDEEGQAGARDAQRTRNRLGIKGPKDNPRPQMALFTARDAGVLGVLPADAVQSPFGADQPLGMDPEDALGALVGDSVGPNFGYGGLGIHGTGRGGGGPGTGTIGVGNVDTVGSTYSPALRQKLHPPRISGPVVVDRGTTVHGSLSKEVIRRVVHRHLNEVKYCYERELAAHPDLAGRVSIKFVINGTGGVQGAVAADSTLGSPAIDSCIAQAVLRWSFPEPEGGGVVIVTYPFQLEAPEQ